MKTATKTKKKATKTGKTTKFTPKTTKRTSKATKKPTKTTKKTTKTTVKTPKNDSKKVAKRQLSLGDILVAHYDTEAERERAMNKFFEENTKKSVKKLKSSSKKKKITNTIYEKKQNKWIKTGKHTHTVEDKDYFPRLEKILMSDDYPDWSFSLGDKVSEKSEKKNGQTTKTIEYELTASKDRHYESPEVEMKLISRIEDVPIKRTLQKLKQEQQKSRYFLTKKRKRR